MASSCGSCGGGAAGGDVYEARTVNPSATLPLDETGRTQGTRAEAIEAAKAAPSASGPYLAKV